MTDQSEEGQMMEKLKGATAPQPEKGWNLDHLGSAIEQIQHKQWKEAENRREAQDEIISELKASRELEEEMEELKAEKEDLEEQLERFQQSVPATVYATLIGGILIIGYAIFLSTDLIYFIGGVTLFIVSISAIYESKIRSNRVR